MFGWFRSKRVHAPCRPAPAAMKFADIELVRLSPQFGNTGPTGWGFTLWGAPDGEELMYRQLLETFSALYPDTKLDLPAWQDCEDMIEGSLQWQSHNVWIWYEIVLAHIWLWSANKDAIEDLRIAILPIARPG